MLLDAADPSSYNLFSGVVRTFCFISEWRQTMLFKVAHFHSEAYNMYAYLYSVLIVSPGGNSIAKHTGGGGAGSKV